VTAVACYFFCQGRNCLILASLSSQVFLFFVLLCRNWFKSIFPWCISCFRVSCASTSQSSSIYTLFFLNMIPNLEFFYYFSLTSFELVNILKGNLDKASPNAGYVLLMFYHLYDGKVLCSLFCHLILYFIIIF